MKYRKLRITWSVLCFIACVLLVALWVRSYKWEDRLHGDVFKDRISDSKGDRNAYYLCFSSWDGALGVTIQPEAAGPDIGDGSGEFEPWEIASQKIASHQDSWYFQKEDGLRIYLNFPHWFALVFVATLAAVPWIRWSKRFSIRTLLIATTLLAVLLGVVAWSMDNQ